MALTAQRTKKITNKKRKKEKGRKEKKITNKKREETFILIKGCVWSTSQQYRGYCRLGVRYQQASSFFGAFGFWGTQEKQEVRTHVPQSCSVYYI